MSAVDLRGPGIRVVTDAGATYTGDKRFTNTFDDGTVRLTTLSAQGAATAVEVGPKVIDGLGDAAELLVHQLLHLMAGPVPQSDGGLSGYCGAVTFNAQRFRSLMADVGWAGYDFDDRALDEFEAIQDHFAGRWITWFETVGAEQLRTIARVAGPCATATRLGFTSGAWTSGGTVYPEGAVEGVFAQFANAWLAAEPDVTGVAVARSLADPLLFVPEVAHTWRRDVERLVERISFGVLPEMAREGQHIVVRPVVDWCDRFWAEALELCFPYRRPRGPYQLMVLPDSIASIFAKDDCARVWMQPASAGLSFDAVTATFAALVGDGLQPDAALETAVAVLS